MKKLSKQNNTENEFDKANRNINNFKKGGNLLLGFSVLAIGVKKYGKEAFKLAKKIIFKA